MAPHLYWKAENLTGQTITDTSTPQQVVELVVPVESGKSYVLMADFGCDDAWVSTSTWHTFDIYDVDNSTALDGASEVCQSSGNSEFATGTLMVQFTAASDGDRTFRIRAVAGDATGLLAKGRLIAIRNEDGDQFAYQSSEQSNTTTTPTAVETLSFTPATAGDYVVVANFVMYNDRGSARYQCDLYDGSSSYGPSSGVYTSPRFMYKGSSIAAAFTSLSGSQSFSFRHWTLVSGNLIKTRTCAIAAFRVRASQDMQSAADGSASTNATSTPTSKLDLIKTFANAPYLLAVSASFDVNLANAPADLNLISNGSEIGPGFRRATNVSSYRWPFAAFGIASHDGTSQTDSLKFDSYNNTNTVSVSGASIVALQLQEPATASGAEILPPSQAATAVANAPTIETGAKVVVPSVAATAVANAPLAGGGASVTVPSVSADVASAAPTIATGASAAPPSQAATATTAAPTISSGVNIAVPSQAASATANAPAVGSGITITVPSVSATATAAAPGIETGVNIVVPSQAVTGASTAPAAGGGALVTVPSVSASAVANAPTVSAAVATKVVVPSVSATAAANAPTVATGASVAPPAANGNAQANAPAVATGAAISVPSVAAAATTSAPSVLSRIAIIVPSVAATAVANAPTIEATGTVGLREIFRDLDAAPLTRSADATRIIRDIELQDEAA